MGHRTGTDDVRIGEAEFELDNSEKVYSLAISPAGSLAAAGLDSRTAIWDVDTQQSVTDLDQAGDIVSLAFSADGSLLATGSSEGIVLLWSVDGNTLTQLDGTLYMAGSPRCLSFSPDQKWLAGGDATNFAYLWDTRTLQELARIPHGNAVTSVSFSPDGAKIACGGADKTVRLFNVADGKELFYIAPDNTIHSVALTTVGTRLVPGTPEPLFTANVDQNRSIRNQFAVTRDGQRFLLMALLNRDASPLVTVLNWRALVRQ